MKKRKRQPPRGNPNWARDVVARMTPEEVRRELERLRGSAALLGIRLPEPPRDTRSPIERLIDEATGYKPKGRK